MFDFLFPQHEPKEDNPIDIEGVIDPWLKIVHSLREEIKLKDAEILRLQQQLENKQ